MSEFTIRPCRVDECQQVLDIWRAYHAPGVSDSLEEAQRLVRDFKDQLLVATNGDRIVGTIIAGWDGWRAHLHHLTVLPEYRRKGIAKALVKDADKRLRAKGAKRVSVHVERDNPAAISFFESLRDQGYELDTWMQRYTRRL